MSDAGKTVRLFLVDGTPGGLLTAEIMNWTGHLIAAPRSELAALLKRPETSRTGVYFLLGDDPDSLGGVRAYIGEADDIGTRLLQHSRPEAKGGKDFWDRVVVLTSKDANLTKAHTRYLESRILDLARDAKRAQLTNGTAPPLPPLPEADRSDMEFFISQARIVLPLVGVNLLRSTATFREQSVSTPGDAAGGSASPVFAMVLRKDNARASAQEIDGEFTVLSGSQARDKWSGVDHGYAKLRDSLVRDGTLISSSQGTALVFTHHQVFSSPSAAAAVVAGRAANGRQEWRIEGSVTTYGDWQSRGVDDALVEEVRP